MSLTISLTMTPMMCARLLRPKSEQHPGFLSRLSERGFDFVLGGYQKSLSWVLGHQPVILFVTLSTVVLTVYLYVIVPKGFFPQQDTGRMGGQILADQASSYEAMRDRVVQIVKIVMQDPAVAALERLCWRRQRLQPGANANHSEAAEGKGDQLG